MKLTISCQECGKILSLVEKPEITQDDLDLYKYNCSCEIHGPFPPEEGEEETPPDNIMVVKIS